jgi:hypothetical protein
LTLGSVFLTSVCARPVLVARSVSVSFGLAVLRVAFVTRALSVTFEPGSTAVAGGELSDLSWVFAVAACAAAGTASRARPASDAAILLDKSCSSPERLSPVSSLGWGNLLTVGRYVKSQSKDVQLATKSRTEASTPPDPGTHTT